MFNGYTVSVWEDENLLETDDGGGCRTMRMYLMPQIWILKNGWNGKLYAAYILPHFFKKKHHLQIIPWGFTSSVGQLRTREGSCLSEWQWMPGGNQRRTILTSHPSDSRTGIWTRYLQAECQSKLPTSSAFAMTFLHDPIFSIPDIKWCDWGTDS